MVNGAAGRAGQLAVHSVEEDLQQEEGAAHHRGNIVRETQWRWRNVTTADVHQQVFSARNTHP